MKDKTLLVSVGCFRDIPVKIVEGQYAHGGKAVEVVAAADWADIMNGEEIKEGERIATVSVWTEDAYFLPEGCFYAKTWSENAELFEQLVGLGVLVPADSLPRVACGFSHAVPCFLSWTHPAVGNAQTMELERAQAVAIRRN